MNVINVNQFTFIQYNLSKRVAHARLMKKNMVKVIDFAQRT